LHIIAGRVRLNGELPRTFGRRKFAAERGAVNRRKLQIQNTFLDGDGTMKNLLLLLVVATLAASAAGCGCCGWCWPKPATTVVAAPAPACPPPVAADPCSVPTTTTYGYAPATGW
jgi:hypothetical protein